MGLTPRTTAALLRATAQHLRAPTRTTRTTTTSNHSYQPPKQQQQQQQRRRDPVANRRGLTCYHQRSSLEEVGLFLTGAQVLQGEAFDELVQSLPHMQFQHLAIYDEGRER